MNNSTSNFGDFEQDVINSNKMGISNVKEKLKLDEIIASNSFETSKAPEILPNEGGMGKPMVRVLNDGTTVQKPQENEVPTNLLPKQGSNLSGTNYNNPLNPSGYSFVLAFAGILLLIFVISIVTFSILNRFNV